MKQKKISLTILLFAIGIFCLRAQQSSNAAGGNATGSGGSASYSVGQVVYTGLPGSSNQGVQQPYEFFTVGIDENKDINLSMVVFPNPAQSVLNLKIENQVFEGLSYQLFDVTGQQLLDQQIYNQLTAIQITKLPAGTYLLRVGDSKKVLKTFSIIKNN